MLIPSNSISSHYWTLSEIRVSFGIMIGFVFNLIFAAAVNSVYGEDNQELTVSLILGAPLIFAIAMLGAVWRCPESPRYFLRNGQSKYNPRMAYEKLKQLRSCEVSIAVNKGNSLSRCI